MLRTVNERRQITLPPKIMKRVGVKIGDYLEIKPDKDRIVLIPKSIEDKFLSRTEWKKLEELVKKEHSQKKFTSYTQPNKAKKHSFDLINEV